MSNSNSNPSSSSYNGQSSSSQSSSQSNQRQLVQAPDVISIANVLDNMVFYRWHLVVVTIVVTVLSAIYAMTATPIYVADSMIQIQPKQQGISSLGALSEVSSSAGASGRIGAGTVDEIEIIKSRSVIGAAIEALQLNVNVTVANRVPLLGIWLARTLEADEQGLVKPPVGWLSYAWGGERLEIDQIKLPQSLIGKPLLLTVEKDSQWQLTEQATGQLLAKGQGNHSIDVIYNSGFTFKVKDLSARPDTQFVIRVVANQSAVGGVLGGLTVTQVRGGSLIDLTYQSPDPAFAALMLNTITNVYLKQSLERSTLETERTIEFINTQLPELRLKLDKAENNLTQFRVKSKIVDMTAELEGLVAATSQLQAQKMELEIKRQEMSTRYDAKHPIMRSLAAELEGIEQQSASLSQRINYLPSEERNYVRLMQNVEFNTRLFIGLLNNKQQLEISLAGSVGNVSIIDPAITPLFAAKPQKRIIVLVGLAAGLVLGFLLTQLMGLLEKVVRDPKKLEIETGIPNLAILPVVDIQQSRSEAGDESPYMVAKETPDSVEVEALRSLRTALIFALSEKPRSKVTLITSAVSSQGKSFISANLSYLLAATGKRTLFIDADIRKSSSHRYFDVDQKVSGLSSVLRGLAAIDDVIIKGIHDNLDYLPPGQRVRNPGDLLAGENLQQIIAQLAERYDYVIIDAPPLLPVHDTRTVAKAVDISLFIARQNTVSLSEVNDAIDVFNKSGNRFDGIIFNGFIPSRLGYRYGYGYGYKYARYGKYGKKYGRYGTYGKYSHYDKHTDENEKP